MSLIQLLKFKKWETRLFKMPHLETPPFQTGTRVTVVASGPTLFISLKTWILQMKFKMGKPDF